jgi:hypothetical protein
MRQFIRLARTRPCHAKKKAGESPPPAERRLVALTYGVLARFAGPNPYALFKGRDEDLSVADVS